MQGRSLCRGSRTSPRDSGTRAAPAKYAKPLDPRSPPRSARDIGRTIRSINVACRLIGQEGSSDGARELLNRRHCADRQQSNRVPPSCAGRRRPMRPRIVREPRRSPARSSSESRRASRDRSKHRYCTSGRKARTTRARTSGPARTTGSRAANGENRESDEARLQQEELGLARKIHRDRSGARHRDRPPSSPSGCGPHRASDRRPPRCPPRAPAPTLGGEKPAPMLARVLARGGTDAKARRGRHRAPQTATRARPPRR